MNRCRVVTLGTWKPKKKKTEIAHRARTEVSGTQGAALLWTEANWQISMKVEEPLKLAFLEVKTEMELIQLDKFKLPKETANS